MVRTVFAKDIKLYELETIFNLREVDAENFFEEWQENLPETTQDEKRLLDRVKANYRNLIKYPPLTFHGNSSKAGSKRILGKAHHL